MTAEQKPEISFASRFRLRIFQFQSKGRIPADFQIQFYMFPFYAYPGCDKRKRKDIYESRDTERDGCCRQKGPERRENGMSGSGREDSLPRQNLGDILKITVDISVCL